MNDKEKKTPKYKNKSERNKNVITNAMSIFKGKKLLNERLPDMPIDDYRLLRKIQSQTLKLLFHKGHSPSRKLSGLMGSKEPLARTKQGMSRVAKRIIKQRKSG